MAVSTLLLRSIIGKSTPYHLSFLKRITPSARHSFNLSPPLLFPSAAISHAPLPKSFCSSSSSSTSSVSQPELNVSDAPKRRNTLVNFSLSDSDSDSESDSEHASRRRKEVDKSKLPPPYDPFNKNPPAIEEPEDPSNLQQVFQNIRGGDGLMNSAVKMFDGLSKDGLTHEALELFSQIKDKGQMPDVVAHTAVIEAYANAGRAKDALKVYMRMLASGVLPNAYTYTVLIKGLVGSGDEKLVKEAKKYVVEMVEKRGIRPNAGVCVGVYQGLVKLGLDEEGIEVLEMLKNKGVVPDETKVLDALKDIKRGPVYRRIMNVFYGK